MTNQRLIENKIRRIVKRVLSEESAKENYIGINEQKPLRKALDAAERIVKDYTKGETKKKAMEALNILYSLAGY
jgi:hypothetical protein